MFSARFYKVTVFTLIASIATLSADDPSPCEENCCFGKKEWDYLMTGTIAGTAAGAIAGYAVTDGKNQGKRGLQGQVGLQGNQSAPTGPSGPTGPAGVSGTFPVDAGESLTFNGTLTVLIGDGNTVTPFVSLPDGTVVLGTPVIANGVTALPPINISPPEFGEYAYGFQVSGAVFPFSVTFLGNVNATRDGSSTVVASATLVPSNEGQLSVNFVYGPPNVP